MGLFSGLRAAFSAPQPAAPANVVWLRRGMGAVVAVGEQHYARGLKKAFRLASDPDNVVIALVPEPDNAHDKNAVRLDVLVDGLAYKAGYIPRSEARGYSRALKPLRESGVTGVGYGKIRHDGSQFQVYARVSDDPAALVPPAIEDPLGTFIDGLYDLVVTGEEAFQDVLRTHASRKSTQVFALHPAVIAKGKYAGESTYAVYLQGNIVGELTRAMAMKHHAALDAVLQSGRRPYLAGKIEKDHRGLQVILQGPLSQRID